MLFRSPENTREKVLSTFPHYGHGGIVESARDLFMQIDGQYSELLEIIMLIILPMLVS